MNKYFSIASLHDVDFLSLACCLLQPDFPIRSEIDVKLGGTQCNLILNRLEPWMSIRLPQKQKKEQIEKIPAKEKSHSSEQKTIMWTCTLSAPEMTVVLYSLSGCPLYHVSSLPVTHLYIPMKCFFFDQQTGPWVLTSSF